MSAPNEEGRAGGHPGGSLTGVVAAVARQARIACIATGEVDVWPVRVPAGDKVIGSPGVLLGPAGGVGDAGIGAIPGIHLGGRGLDFVDKEVPRPAWCGPSGFPFGKRDRLGLSVGVKKKRACQTRCSRVGAKRPSGDSEQHNNKWHPAPMCIGLMLLPTSIEVPTYLSKLSFTGQRLM